MIQIARKFFRGENLVCAVAAIVIAANAGGAFSPVGDVTTIMLWLGGKFQSTEIIVGGFSSITCSIDCGIVSYGFKNKGRFI
ncbi:MAG: hypothetical protein A3J54_03550 [Candidatus Ryanbacteria bacterium RIFCSPHIGHO2_02_FULL_45_13b]|uniref:Citrate transporter-like domain-containing protein n=1 Tax=Candidatus Ryanbacteria bacterium RIFCSPHIGHO2_02_FULL_45_13b TaxID=1802117 RepID=A0A1G2G4J6_9BACT|nr:MAG: hypothetical protein A3J54_03550 [Candidatus Ryanbacteria bacterium RIFCSPHIGHO2_02_FULL_45_13b]